jgi:membrane protease YdiL (CAAX protease family)
MKYFRIYPLGFQLFLFLLMVLVLLSTCASCLYILLPKIAGIDFAQLSGITESSPYRLIKISVMVQGIASVAMFLLPSLLFAYLTHPKPMGYVGFRKPAKPVHLLLAVLLMLGAMPILEQIQSWVGLINFSTSIKASQAQSEATMKAFLTMPTFGDLLRTFLVVAIIPAIGEELFFRGILTRLIFKWSKSIVFSIFFTSCIFAFTHTNIYGFVSIALAGALLATVYYLTSSLWCGILAHMCFNGTNIILVYLGRTNTAVNTFNSSDHMPVWLLATSAIVFSGSLYFLIKTKNQLPPTWADDFDTPPPPPAGSPEFDSLN